MLRLIGWWLPITLFVLASPWTPEWDLSVSHFFYQEDHFQQNRFYQFIYNYGTWPALGVGVLSCILLALSFYKTDWATWRRPALFLLAVLILFEGFVVHTVLKDHWGRPRPKQVIEFGGQQSFRPFYLPDFSNKEPAKSFPCGHCGMGFYFLALAWLGWRKQSKLLFWSGLALTLLLGGLLSWIRLAQGGHFLSDVMGSFLVLWYGTLICHHWILPTPNSRISSHTNLRKDFSEKTPNKETIEAMRECEEGRGIKCESIEDFWEKMGLKPNAIPIPEPSTTKSTIKR